MDLQKISLEPIRSQTVAILGYGNQGHAHALNLRDSGVRVIVGARDGAGSERAMKDGFAVVSLSEAARQGTFVMFLLPDEAAPGVYHDCLPMLRDGAKTIGFSHGFALTFNLIEALPSCAYCLVSPKGAGALLRQTFCEGQGLPGVFALGPHATALTRDLCLSYAKAVGLANRCLIETTFQEETECDLFGEQAVLCGGIMQLMEKAFEVLVKNGFSREMAFFECCYEARLILELWLKFGPSGMTQKISPTAFYGGLTRGRRLVSEDTGKELQKIFDEIHSGVFAKEWMREVKNGKPQLQAETDRLRGSDLETIYQKLRTSIFP